MPGCRRDRPSASAGVLCIFAVGLLACLCGTTAILMAQAQSRANARVENVVQAARRSYEKRPPEWRRRAASCLHYLDEAEPHHKEGVAYFVEASKARSSPEESRLVRLGNEAMAERNRLIREFWACTRRMTTGDEFASQEPPSDRKNLPPNDPDTPPSNPGKPPSDPGGGPPASDPAVPPQNPAHPEQPPNEPWHLPPGFPLPPAEARPSRPSTPTKPTPSSIPVIVAVGDSITAGYGLKPTESYPAVLQKRLQTEGFPHRVMNAGVSNDTAADARRRLPQALVPRTRILIIAVGLNDSKAARPIAQIKADLAAIIEQAQRRGIAVLLCGFKMPLTFDDAYAQQFKDIYPALAAQYHVALIPDLMSIVWNSDRMTSDGFHPNPAGARLISSQVFRALRPMLVTGGATTK